MYHYIEPISNEWEDADIPYFKKNTMLVIVDKYKTSFLEVESQCSILDTEIRSERQYLEITKKKSVRLYRYHGEKFTVIKDIRCLTIDKYYVKRESYRSLCYQFPENIEALNIVNMDFLWMQYNYHHINYHINYMYNKINALKHIKHLIILINDADINNLKLLPDTLISFEFMPTYEIQPYSLKEGLKTLIIHKYGYSLKKGIFPESLDYLELCDFNIQLYAAFPSNLKYLKMDKYNKSVPYNILPANLIYLSMNSLCETLNGVLLPPKLRYLILNSYRGYIDEIPDSIEILELLVWNLLRLPLNLIYLCVNSIYYINTEIMENFTYKGSVAIKDSRGSIRKYKHLLRFNPKNNSRGILNLILSAKRKNIFIPVELYELIWNEYI